MSEAPNKGFFGSIAESYRKSRQFLNDRKHLKALTDQKTKLQHELDALCLDLGQRAQTGGIGKDLPAFAGARQAQADQQAAGADQADKSAVTAQAQAALQAEQTRREPALATLREAHEKTALKVRATSAELGSARKDVAAGESDLARVRSELSSAEGIASRPLPPEPGDPPTPPPPAGGTQLLDVEAPEAGGPEAASPPAPPQPDPAAEAYRQQMQQYQARARAHEQGQAAHDQALRQVEELKVRLGQVEQALDAARAKLPALEQADAVAQAEDKTRAADLAEAEKSWQQARAELDGRVQAAQAEEKAAAAAASAAGAKLKEAVLALGRAVVEADLSDPELEEPMAQARQHKDQTGQIDQQSSALQAEMDQLRGPFMRATFFTIVAALLATIIVIGLVMLIKYVF